MKKPTGRAEEVYSSDVFEILFDYELARIKRNPAPLALMQIEITATAANVETLKAAPSVFIQALNSHLRSVDIPSKAGQDFRVLLPSTDEPGARTVCERMVSIFKNKFDLPSGPVAFTLQIGTSICPVGKALSMSEITEKTKEALKQSRLKGPNTFVIQ